MKEKSTENQSLDFSGLTLFWEVIDVLKQNAEPEEDSWAQLFATPGYWVLTKSEFSTEFFKQKWRVAYKPSMASERAAALAKGDRFLKHYHNVLERRDELRSYAQELKQEGALVATAKRLALQYLPQAEYEGYPPVSFVVFDCDARGYTPVVVDILAAKEFNEGLGLLLAHEFHHYYRYQLLPSREIPQALEDLWWVIEQIHCEGVADLINRYPKFGAPQHKGYRQMVAQAPEYLKMFNDKLIEIQRQPHISKEIGKQIRQELPQSGHPVGFYMARMILEQLGKEVLVSEVNDPLAFFKSYLQAEVEANNNSSYLTMQALDILEQLFS